MGDFAFSSMRSINKVVIPDGISYVQSGLFSECNELSEVTVLSSVKCIGDSAFDSCFKLGSIKLSKDLIYIGAFVFSGCSALAGIDIPETVSVIGEYAFNNCSSFERVTLPEGLTVINPRLFFGCVKLESVTIPRGVVSIGKEAFSNCLELEEIVIPKGVQTIGEFAFNYCMALKKVYFPATLTSIHASAFMGGNGQIAFDVVFCGTESQWTEIGSYVNKKSITYHQYDDGVQTSEPTHIKEGTFTYTCALCDGIRTEKLDKLPDHEFPQKWKPENAAQHIKECPCGEAFQSAPHNWDNGTVTPSTHLKEGKTVYACTDCGYERSEVIEKTTEHTHDVYQKHNDTQHKSLCACGEDFIYEDHSWDDGEVTDPPTANEEGTKTFSCTDCGQTRTESVPALGGDSSGADGSEDGDISADGDTDKGGVEGSENGGNLGGGTHAESEGDQPEADTDEDTGCGAILGNFGTLIFLLASLTVTVCIRKKKEI